MLIAQAASGLEHFDLVKAIGPSIAAGAIGFFASRWAIFQNRRTQDISSLCARMERAYMLRQKLYDGHKREISLFRGANTETTREDWLKNRNHPGEIMAEIRMIVTMYAPSLHRELNTCAEYHGEIKRIMFEIDTAVQKGDTSAFSDQPLKDRLSDLLDKFGEESHTLRDGIVNLVQKATKVHS